MRIGLKEIILIAPKTVFSSMRRIMRPKAG
jgi:hypothetical protein